jgi:hypothetical protein
MKTLDDAPPPDCWVCGQATVRVCWCHTGEVMDRRPCQCGEVVVWPETVFEGAKA